MHSNNLSNKALLIIPLGKLFHIMQNIIYLLLDKFRIIFVYSYLPFHYNYPEQSKFLICYCCVPPQNFHSGAKLSAPSFLNCLVFVLCVDPFVVGGGGLAVEYFTIFISTLRSFVVVVLVFLFHIIFFYQLYYLQ